MKTYVLYHDGCADGFCSAWIARKYLVDAIYIPVRYGEPSPEIEQGSRVYILDFSYPRRILTNLIERGCTLTVIDHHKTAQAALDGFADQCVVDGLPRPEIIFDMEHSGARLTYDYFFGNEYLKRYSDSGIFRPWLVDYVEDRDMWWWKLPSSREISAWVRSHPFDFERWDRWTHIQPGDTDWLHAVREGGAILRSNEQVIDEHLARAEPIVLDGFNGRVVNSSTYTLQSDIAGRLAEGVDFGACYFDDRGVRRWSLRSGTIDVSEIARARGGGGHRGAAGYEQKLV